MPGYQSIKLIAILIFNLPDSILAANTVLSGDFDGSEATTLAMPGTCSGAGELAYQESGPFQVSSSGNYTVTDAFNYYGIDISANIYQGNFDPNSPAANRVTPDGIDRVEDIMLNSGTDYVLVVQRWCLDKDRVSNFRDGAWAVTFSGPGSVTSAHKVNFPDWTEGDIADNDPLANTDCGNSRYAVSGPVRVMRSGEYYYSEFTYDSPQPSNLDVCVQVFTAPFDPANPQSNRVGEAMNDLGIVELESGTDYYFLVQPINPSATGSYFYVLAPPEIRISMAMAGGWFYPATSGQGFFLDVYDERNTASLGWYTYDLQRPDASVEALIGDPGHRWLTAQGGFSGNKARLDIYWTSGMIFDSATPEKNPPIKDGHLDIEFFDCYSGQIDYEIESVNLLGIIPIQRLSNDAVPLCQVLSDGPGKVGAL